MSTGGKGSSSKQTVGFNYYIGLHFVLCHGVIDSVTQVNIDDRELIRTEINSNSVINVNKAGLFGGDSGEGGFSGNIDFEFGEDTQAQNNYLLSKLGATLPSFRGVMAAIFNQCYVGNNPYLKGYAFRCSRVHKRQNGLTQWYDSKAGVNEIIEYGLLTTLYDTATGGVNFGSASNGRIDMSLDGTQLLTGNGFNKFAIVNLSTAYDISSGVFSGSIDVRTNTGIGGNLNTVKTIQWKNDGSRLFIEVTGTVERWMLQYSASSAYNATTLTYFNKIDMSLIAGFGSMPDSWVWANNGFVLSGVANSLLFHKTFSTAYDVSTLLSADSVGTAGDFRSITWRNNGTVLLIYVDATYGTAFVRSIRIYKAAIAYDIRSTDVISSIVAASEVLDVSSVIDLIPISAMIWNKGTSRIIITGGTKIHQFTVGDSYYTGDLNPAHIIREAITDPTWGLAFSESVIDDVTFMAAADALFSEGMGMSLLWTQQIRIQEFIQNVLRHIDAVLFVDLNSGLFVLKLIRNDYDVNTVFSIDETNIVEIQELKRPASVDLVNEVTINYHDRENNVDATIKVQDIADILQKGITVGTTIRYDGFTSKTIAAKVADRDLVALSTPLLSCTITTSRVANGLNIGSPFKVNWPDLKIIDVVFRVTSLAYDDGRSGKIKIQCVQDIFALPNIAVITPADPEWIDTSIDPVPMVDEYAAELPYFQLVQFYRQSKVDKELSNNTNFGQIGVTGDSPQDGMLKAQIYSDDGAGYVENGSMAFCPFTKLSATIGYLDSIITFTDTIIPSFVRVGSYAVIDNEFILIDVVTDTGATIRRGVLDTMPATHNNNAQIFFIEDYWAFVGQEFVSGESINIKLPTLTGSGQLDINAITAQTVVLNQRALRPYPPQNVRFGGTNIYYPTSIGLTDTLIIDWAHRNRLQQTGGVHLSFIDGDVTPESGLTYTLRIFGDGGTIKRTVLALTGTTYTYLQVDEMADNGGILNTDLRIELESVVNSVICLFIFNYSFIRA